MAIVTINMVSGRAPVCIIFESLDKQRLKLKLEHGSQAYYVMNIENIGGNLIWQLEPMSPLQNYWQIYIWYSKGLPYTYTVRNIGEF